MEYNERHIEAKLRETAKYFKVVLILGARQVGKSTLLEHVFPHAQVVLFDPLQDLYNVRQDPDLFLNNFPAPLILDEVQYVPELLPALKRRVDRSEKKGQYFLTGSQNFSVLKTIAESMAGRVGILHLDGFTPEEILGCGSKKGWLSAYLSDPEGLRSLVQGVYQEFSNLTKFLWRGTYPEVLTIADTSITRYFASYLQTYVERDVRVMENIKELADFSRFLGIAAALSGQEINASQLGREIGVAPATARRWLDLLAYSYQWLELFPYHGNTIKRISGKRKGHFRDTGLICYLQRISSPDALLAHPQLGAIFESWVVNYIHRQFVHLPLDPYAYHWRSHGGAEVDLILEMDGKLYPIEIKCKTMVSKQDASGVKAFKETYPHQKVMPGLVIYCGSKCFAIDQDVIALPWNAVISQ
jgi:predicted AAA+ superfamily ATPase